MDTLPFAVISCSLDPDSRSYLLAEEARKRLSAITRLPTSRFRFRKFKNNLLLLPSPDLLLAESRKDRADIVVIRSLHAS
jgi:hypothetical protein